MPPARAAAGPSEAELRVGEGVHDFHLENGLRAVLVESHANPFVALTAVVHAGSLDEARGTAGSSHFLEHLLFHGTEEMSQHELYDAVDRIGAYNNASTRADHTVFLMLAPSRHLARAAHLQSQMLFHSRLADEAFESERGIVAEEIRKDRDRESYRAGLLLDEQLFTGTRLSQPVLGHVEDIEGLREDRVRAYYNAHYVPSNVTLLVVGDVTPGELREVLHDTYGQASGAKLAGRPDFELPVEGPDDLLLIRPADLEKAWIKAVVPGPPAGSREAEALSLLADLWNQGAFSPSGRPTANASLRRLRGTSFLELSGSLPQGMSPAEAVGQMGEALNAAARTRPGREVVERAVRKARVAEAGLLERPHYYGLMRADIIAAASVEPALARIDQLREITPALLQETARRWMAGSPLRAVVVGPGQTTASQRIPRRPQTAPAAGGPELARPPGEEGPAGRVTRRVLPNGLVVLVETDPAAELAAFHLLARHRSAREPDGLEGIADLLHRMLTRGTENRSAEALQHDIDSLGASLKVTDQAWIPYDDYYFSPEFSFIRLEVLAEDAEEALQLLADMVLHPALTDGDFEEVRGEMRGVAESRAGEARHRARRAFGEALYGDHPLAADPLGTPESLARITPAQLRAFHKTYFAPSNLILSVVSPMPAEPMLAAVRRLFPGDEPVRQSRDVPALEATEEAPSRRVVEVGRDQAVLYMGRVLDVAEEDWPALLAANAVLSDRLAFRIREREGLAYGVGSSVQRSPYGTWFAVSAGTAPDQVEKVEELAREEIDGLARGLGRPELERAVGSLVGRALMRRMPSISRAYYLGLGELEGRRPEQGLETLQALQEVTPRQARKAARAYLTDGPLVVVEAR